MSRYAGVIALVLLLSGCGSALPPPEAVRLDPVPGVSPPLSARVMIFAGQGDLDRKLRLQVTRLHSEDGTVKDGAALASAARTMLSKAFSRVEINDPSIRPQIVVRLYGKGMWSKPDTQLVVGCGIDVFTADGFPLGNFGNRFEVGSGDYESTLTASYAQCLKRPVEQFLASSGLARLAATGFRDPPPVAVERWMQTLGPIPSPR
ncbi:putative periplasmic lipoprotein [Magnetospirillum molischianum]|uniref:Lipoprotein n=1 Tax=Magnetospirillum molischianum DSM 120 TaxID=1150626 RepID=H8FPT2_MAGML|nr:hypothetical protein [Magnetospirillum molischianum]CCG40370.1 conserved exported hypothetical protein [Magnetospirillum molischianum DSM 120]